MVGGQALRERRREAYEQVRIPILERIPPDARRVLDLGCASGALGAALKARQQAFVVGVELVEAYAADAARVLDRVICADIDAGLSRADLGRFDCVVAADVLEHLVDPWATLRRAATLLEPGGTAIVSLPNVQYLKTFLVLARGSWPREDAGLFDRTHLRWFTRRDACELIAGAGLSVCEQAPQYWFRGRALVVASRLGAFGLAPFLAGQFIFAARRPSA